MKNLIFIPILLSLILGACQNTDSSDPQPTDGSNNDALAFTLANVGQAYGKALVTDAQDNFYYTSLFQGSISGKSMLAAGVIDNYFAKHNQNGQLIWEKSFGGAGSITVGHGLAADGTGNVYITGYFGDETTTSSLTIDFGNGITATSKSGYDVFLAKYNPDGSAAWALALGNTNGATEERAWDIAVANNGDTYIAGAFTGTVNFDPLGATPKNVNLNSVGHFIAKYNSDGQNQWVQALPANITNIFAEGYTSLDLNQQGQVLLTGVYRDVLTLGGQSINSAGQSDIFLASFETTNGQLNWLKSFGGPGVDIVSPGAMRVNGVGEPHLTGRFSGVSNFGGVILTSNSPGNTFVLACNANGEPKWGLVHTSNSGLDGGHRVDFDNQGNVYVAGWFRGTATFDQTGTTQLISHGTNDAGDVFLAKYSSNGGLLWARHFGAEVSGAENLSICAGLGIDSQGNALITGKFYGVNADYDPNNATSLMFSSEGQDDCFVAKYTSEGELYKKP